MFFPRGVRGTTTTDAGWSSPVARQAHNLKVIGSNPIPATTFTEFANIALVRAENHGFLPFRIHGAESCPTIMALI
jgi:hypothetical protein